MNRNILIGLIVGIIVIVGLVWFMQRNQSVAPESADSSLNDTNTVTNDDYSTDMGAGDETTSVPLVSSPAETSPAATTVGAVKEFTVTGSNFKFAPNEMRVKQGDTVRVTFQNSGGSHDWNLDEFNASTKVLQAGQQETVEFTASKTGSFEYYCSVGTHRQMGMKGMLIVE